MNMRSNLPGDDTGDDTIEARQKLEGENYATESDSQA
jgi:hypothetical protein